ncbi:MAG: cytochrome C oxidase subunit IV family protein [Thaumarchaeota archaeon]|nr:cytochrome C oxidase subunit IV family protein [Nitrososphaerota archaeon]
MKLIVYAGVFAFLMATTAVELMTIGMQLPRNILVTIIMSTAGLKAVVIAMFFQHLKDEPKALSILVIIPIIAAAALIGISILSIQPFVPSG